MLKHLLNKQQHLDEQKNYIILNNKTRDKNKKNTINAKNSKSKHVLSVLQNH